MAAMHRQRLLRKGVKSLPTNCAWFVGLAILWHVSHFQCLSRTASMGRVRWRKLVLLSLLMGLSKQLTSSNSFITWASLCEMVYSLRIRLCGVSHPPNLSPRRLFAYFPLQGCTDPPTPPHPGLQCECFALANALSDVLFRVPNLFPQDLQVPQIPQLASEKGKERKPEVPTKAGWVLEDGNRSIKPNIFCKLLWCSAEYSELQTCIQTSFKRCHCIRWLPIGW